jgi:5-methylcytosine-specific restriction endonuclease McrA
MSRPCLTCRQEMERCLCQVADDSAHSGGWANRSQRDRVLARDGWLCQVCDRYINPRIRPPEPGAAHLDRLRPLESGGLDAEWNLRATHFECAGGTAR